MRRLSLNLNIARMRTTPATRFNNRLLTACAQCIRKLMRTCANLGTLDIQRYRRHLQVRSPQARRQGLFERLPKLMADCFSAKHSDVSVAMQQ